MRKFQNTPEPEGKKPPPPCLECGWDFNIPHLTTIFRAGVKKTRNDSRVKISYAGSLLCDVCYEKLLIRQNRHPYSDMTQHDMDTWGKTAVMIARCFPFLEKFLRDSA